LFRAILICLFLCILCNGSDAQCTSVINVFPYTESFETGTANWITGGTNNDWAWCTPSKTVISSAGNGTKCWITGGPTASFYNYGERSWVESPCFDFTNVNRPEVSFLLFVETERSYDGGNLQYSTDGGVSWLNVGAYNDPDRCTDKNWYNINNIINLHGFVTNSQGWSGNVQPTSSGCNGGGGTGAWAQTSHCLKGLGHKPQVKFRFTFGSGTTCNDYDGFAFDNFSIAESPPSPTDFIYTCVDSRTLSFSELNSDCHDHWSWDFGDPQSANNTFIGKKSTHEFSSGGTFSVTLSTGGACAADTLLTRQVKLISANAQSTPVSCVGEDDGTATVTVLDPVAGVGYSWSHDPLNTTSTATGLIQQDYYVTITEPGLCTYVELITVGIGPDAYPQVSLGEDTIICSGSEIILYPGSYSTYHWQDNSGDSIFNVKEPGEYSVKISNKAGCTASDTIYIKEDCINDIIIPNAFTPNGDNMNESFMVVGSETTDFEIFIFNRWGEVVYSASDQYKSWDGSYKGKPVEEGFYNYIVNYSIGKSERMKKGSIYLLR
jgi:gliding motility-associated-like protein